MLRQPLMIDRGHPTRFTFIETERESDTWQEMQSTDRVDDKTVVIYLARPSLSISCDIWETIV
jgi:hypothetical protein